MPTPPPEPVADLYCRAYRAGLAWKDVLARAGVSRMQWWRFETGRRSPRLRDLAKLSEAIDELTETTPPDPATSPAHPQEDDYGATRRN